VLKTSTGDPLSFNNALSICPSITAAGSNSFGIAVADASTGAIAFGSSPFGQAGAGGAPPGYSWTVIATGQSNVTKVVVGSSEVFWQSSTAIRRVSIGGGQVQTVNTGDTLLAVESGTVYVQNLGDATYTLKRIAPNGTTTELAYNDASFAPGFTFDANHFYWTEGSGMNGTTHRLRRVAKAGGTPSTFHSSQSAKYESPLTDGSYVWWRQVNLADGSARLRRKNLSNDHYVDIPFPTPGFSAMRLMPDFIYVTGLLATNPDSNGLGHTAR
jgi:hypothetical protein